MPVSVARCLTLFVLQALLALGSFAAIKAGVATGKITPPELPFFLSGYAARSKPAETVSQDLFAKALAFEDDRGNRAVLITTDLIGIPRDLRDLVAAELQKSHGLEPKSLILNCSHTHSGPAVRANLEVLFSFDREHDAKTLRYREFLRHSLVEVASRALSGLQPATVAYGVGEATFAVDRRALRILTANPSANPPATVDHSVPVLRVTGMDGKRIAVVFGYACHNTTLTGEFLEVSADYAGHAQAELERAYPGATALFVMLCGGDQNPHPRSRKELAETHGQSLAAAVKAALAKPLSSVDGEIRTSFVTRLLPLRERSRSDIEAEQGDQDLFRRRRAHWIQKRIGNGEVVSSVAYPAQALRIGEDFVLVALGGEVVVDYAHAIKRLLAGKRVIVAAYSNDVMCYIPTLRVLREGGYEADDSMIYYGQTGPFTDAVEIRVMEAVASALEGVGLFR